MHELTAQSSMTSYPITCKKIPNHRDGENFLCGLRLHKASKHSRCVTWLELYTLFRLQGYDKPVKNPADPADKRATLDKQIRTFKNNIREHARRTLIEEHAQLFMPGCMANDDLTGVGMLGRHAGPNFSIAIDQPTRDLIAHKLVLMGHSIGAKKAHEHIMGKRGIIPIKLSIKGKIAWDNSFKVSEPPKSDTPWEYKHAGLQLRTPREVTFFKCPTCARCTRNTASNFRRDELDCKIKCEWCRKASESARWTCTCDSKWYMCAEHRAFQRPLQWISLKRKKCHNPEPVLLTGKVLKHSTPVPHVLMKQDIARYEGKRRLRSSHEDDIVLGNAQPVEKRPRLLGPILSKRFALS